MRQAEQVKGKRVLVTGAGTGIGRGVAIAFARAGARVAIHYAHSDAGARSAIDEIQKAGGQAEAFQADLSRTEEVADLAGVVHLHDQHPAIAVGVVVYYFGIVFKRTIHFFYGTADRRIKV